MYLSSGHIANKVSEKIDGNIILKRNKWKIILKMNSKIYETFCMK